MRTVELRSGRIAFIKQRIKPVMRKDGDSTYMVYSVHGGGVAYDVRGNGPSLTPSKNDIIRVIEP